MGKASSAGRHRTWQRIFAFVWSVACLIAATVITLPARSAQAADGVVQVHTMPTAMNFVGHLEADNRARRLFEIGDAQEGGMKVAAYDLDSFAPISSFVIPGSSSGFGGMLSAMDEQEHKLYIMYPEGPVGAPKVAYSIAVVDTTTNALVARRMIAEAPASPRDESKSNDTGFKAMSFYRPPDGGTPKLYLLSQVPVGLGEFSAGTHSVVVTEVDAARLGTSDPTIVNWRFYIPQCAMAVSREAVSVIYRTRDGKSIFVPCKVGGAPGLFSQPLETPGIVEIEVVAGNTPADTSRFGTDFFPISGNLQWGMATVDEVAERMLVHVDGSTTESAVWLFDMPRTSWLGASILPPQFNQATMGLGVDRNFGRMYVANAQGALVVGSTRKASAEQGRVVSVSGAAAVNRARMVIDDLRHRLFMTTPTGFAVLEDRMGLEVVPDPVDPDSNTADLSGPGTAVNFSTGGQAYGSRIRWVRGVRGVERNANTIVDNLSYPQPPSQGTRDLHFARVISATLNNGEATAKATAAERDRDNTDTDIIFLTTLLKDHSGIDLTDDRWPYATVECTDFGGSSDKRTESSEGATVNCDRSQTKVTAVAFQQAMQTPEQVSIGHSWANTTVVNDPARGVVSVSEAGVTGVVIMDQAGIGRMISRSETWAAGRPGTAGANFTRVIQDVWVIDPQGERKTVCGQFCDPELVRITLNRALGVRARMDLPQPDQKLYRGTPKGYEALVVRDQFERANERSVNEEADEKRLEVPALVLTVFADGRSPSRVVLSFAATAAESHFGIYGPGKDPVFGIPRTIVDAVGSLGSGTGLDGSVGGGSAPKRMAASVAKIVKKTLVGFKFFLASPGHAARAGALWLFLAAPLLLWMRRAALIR